MTMFVVSASADVGGETQAQTTSTQTLSFASLPNDTHTADYGLAAGAIANYGAKTGTLTAIKDFDTWVDNKVTLAADADMYCENWRWAATADNAVIVVFEFNKAATLSIAMNTGATAIGGWLDDTNISVHKKSGEAAIEKLSEKDSSADSVAFACEVAAGDIIYYVFSLNSGVTGSRNIQNVHGLTATMNEVTVAEPAKTETISFGDLQNDTHTAEYGLKDSTVVKYGAKTGSVTAPANFDTWSDKSLKLSTDATLEMLNWKWTATPTNSIIVVFEFKYDAVISIAISTELAGWLENSNIALYKKSGTAELEELRKGAASTAAIAYSGEFAAGDIFYFVYALDSGVQGSRNASNVQNISAVVTEIKENEADKTAADYKAELEEYVATLKEADYSAENWLEIGEYVESFLTEAGDKTGALLKVVYESSLAKIKAVMTTAQELTELISKKTAEFTKKTERANAEDFTAENFAKIAALNTEFAAAVKLLATQDEVNNLYNEYLDKLSAVQAITTKVSFLDMVDDVYEANYGLAKQFGLIEYGLKYGKVTGTMSDYDAYIGDSSSHRIYSSTLGVNDVVAHNWQWVATKQNSVIAVFKAVVDCKMDIVCTRAADGDAIGWTVNTNITVYINRGEENKVIYSVNTPATDAAFGGTFYAKAGDIIYYEYNTDHMSQTVNIQTPFATTLTVDSTGFNQDAYDSQNNDLSAEVTEAIASRYAQLVTFVTGKSEDDYSATNWATLQAVPDEFKAAAATSIGRNSTVADVTELYNEYLAEAEAVLTVTEENAAFETAKQTKKDEVRAYADKMLKDNKYSAKNKELIESYVTAAIEEITEATTTKGINDAVTRAKNSINNVEVQTGCSGEISAPIMIIALFAFTAAACVMKKKYSR